MAHPMPRRAPATTARRGPGVGAFGQGKAPPGDTVVAAARPASAGGEGRDYTDLGRLIHKRGSPASRRDRKVALTFDDGPVLQTHRVLETLERYGARGTFFLVGHKFDGHQDLIRAAAERRP